MTDKPIIFSWPMVRALLDGRKTQTRRVLKQQPDPRLPAVKCSFLSGRWALLDGFDGSICGEANVPYAVGDRLWVKETFTLTQHGIAVYRADARDERGNRWSSISAGDPDGEVLWKTSIFMPRAESRLTLIVTDVRVQRVQDISKDDALAEGVHPDDQNWAPGCVYAPNMPAHLFGMLWDQINAKRGWGWSVNPWVVAVTFRVVKANIDSAEATQ